MAEPPAGEAQVDAPTVLIGCLDNWAARRTGHRSETTFETGEANGWVAIAYAALAGRLDEDPAAAAVAREEAICHTSPLLEQPAVVTNALAFALTGLTRDARLDDVLRRLVELGGHAPSLGSLQSLLWRAALLARLKQRANGFADELAPLVGRLERSVQRTSPVGPTPRLDVVARTGWVLSTAAGVLGSQVLQVSARRAIDELESALDDRTVESAVTAHIGYALLAAVADDRDALRLRLQTELLNRFDIERRLLRAEREADRYDSSAWGVLALIAANPRLRGVEAVLNPPVPGPPRFEIRKVHAAGEDLVIEIDECGRVFERRFSALDLNLLLSRFVDHLPDHLSPRLHAHAVISIFDLLHRITDPTTREALDRQTRHSLELLLRRQSENGGWPYGRKSQASVVHSAGGARRSIFPDLQYTIDTAVPGLALARAYAHTGDAQYLEAAMRGFHFLEEHVGRVDWQGRPLWKLYPADDKTARSGSAVNYELWIGAFFASLGEISSDSSLRDRIAGYLDDIVDYSASLTTDGGDIAYGDYVRELRTPYASWDAMLLADIGHHAGHVRATELAERLVDRLAAVMLPSGALPNVVDYARTIGAYEVPSAHRHGIGVYPVRSYYQLYFVAAAAAVRRQPEAAARAFAFAAVTMLDTTFGAATAGYGARGDREDSPAELWRIGRDWLLTASAALPWFAGLDYHPAFTNIKSEAERLEAMAIDFESTSRDRVADRGTRSRITPEEHPLGPDARRVLAAASSGRGPDPSDVNALVSGQAPNGLWRAPPEAPSGDQRTVDVLLPLVEAKLAGLRDEQLDAAIHRGISGAWVKLFHPTQGIGYLKPPRKGRMPPNLAAEYALMFALASAAGVESASASALEWSRLILRYLVTSQRRLDGALRLDHQGRALGAHEAKRTSEAVRRTVSLLVRQ